MSSKLSALLASAFALTACSVQISDPAGRACDDAHPCADGRVCHQGTCVEPESIDTSADGGGADDAGEANPSCASDPLVGDPCSAGVGECSQSGQLICGPNGLECSVSGGTAVAEVCDGKDNDCDGVADEELTPPACALTQGVCASSPAPMCQGAAGWTACDYGADFQGTETKCDGRDNDCDGVVDEVSGCLLTIGGGPVPGFVDGAANTARFSYPKFLATDGNDFYIADRGNHAIRKVDGATGAVTTIAGTGRCGFQDGPVATALLCEPYDVELSPGGVIYFSDSANHRIRKLEAGVVTTIAGTGQTGRVDGPALTAARFNEPRGLALMPNGDLLIADRNTHTLRRYDAGTQQVSTFAGTGVRGNTLSTPAASQFDNPEDVLVDSAGNVYTTEHSGDRIRMIPAGGGNLVHLGGATSGTDGYTEGVATASRFADPSQLALDVATATLFVADYGNQRIRAVPLDPTQTTFTVVGGAQAGWHNGVGTATRLVGPGGLVKVGGSLYLLDLNHVLRRADFNGNPNTTTTSDVAGGLSAVRSVDGDATSARMFSASGLARASDGTFYFTEDDTNLVRRMTPGGVIETIGGDEAGYTTGTAQGALADARFNDPRDVEVGPDGRVYVADEDNDAVKVIDLAAGTVTVFAGSTNGASGYVNGTGTTARFNGVRGVAYGKDASGQDVLYVTDRGNRLVRKITLPGAEVTTLAGTQGVFGTADGAPGVGRFGNIEKIAADLNGNVYVTDGSLVRHVSPTGVIDTLHGAASTALGIALDGSQLVFAVNDALYSMPTTGGTPTLIFDGQLGVADGLNGAAGTGRIVDIAISPEAYFLLDYEGNRIRRLWR